MNGSSEDIKGKKRPNPRTVESDRQDLISFSIAHSGQRDTKHDRHSGTARTLRGFRRRTTTRPVKVEQSADPVNVAQRERDSLGSDTSLCELRPELLIPRERNMGVEGTGQPFSVRARAAPWNERTMGAGPDPNRGRRAQGDAEL